MIKNNNLKKNFAIVSILIDKNMPSFKFQSMRKEDLYKKGRKGSFLNYIFFMGSLLFKNSKKIKIKTVVNLLNLKLNILVNCFASNLLILKTIKYRKNIKKIK